MAWKTESILEKLSNIAFCKLMWYFNIEELCRVIAVSRTKAYPSGTEEGQYKPYFPPGPINLGWVSLIRLQNDVPSILNPPSPKEKALEGER